MVVHDMVVKRVGKNRVYIRESLFWAFWVILFPVAGLLYANEASTQPIDCNALVRQLGDEDAKVRDEAVTELARLGEAARPDLEKASNSDDPEVRWRAGMLLTRLNQP